MSSDYPLTAEEFKSIYSKVPRTTVEIILKSPKGIYLTLRDIEPCKGKWHLPGGTVYFGESLNGAVQRIAKKELGIDVITGSIKYAGYIEYPGHYNAGIDHPIGLAFEVNRYDGTLTIDKEASKGGWFSKVPKNMHEDQDIFLTTNGYLS